jgi:hypothetical protein
MESWILKKCECEANIDFNVFFKTILFIDSLILHHIIYRDLEIRYTKYFNQLKCIRKMP